MRQSNHTETMDTMRRTMRELMRRKGWKDADLAEACGMSQPSISRFLNGTHNDPKTTTVQKWAVALGVTEAQLCGSAPLTDHKHVPTIEESEANQVRADYLRLSIKHRAAVRALISSLLPDLDDPQSSD